MDEYGLFIIEHSLFLKKNNKPANCVFPISRNRHLQTAKMSKFEGPMLFEQFRAATRQWTLGPGKCSTKKNQLLCTADP